VAKVDDVSLLKLWKTGNHYHLAHSFALLACGFVASPYSHIAGALFLSGSYHLQVWCPPGERASVS
jgi:uncharacterized membrane protein YgdD (TMEM256/DUF423 family)